MKKHAHSTPIDYFGMYRSTLVIEGGLLKEYLLLDTNFMVYSVMDSSDYCEKKEDTIRRDYIGSAVFTFNEDSIRFQFDSLATTRSKGSFYRNGELIIVYSKKFEEKRPEFYYGKYTHDTLYLTLKTIDMHYKDTTFQKITYVKCR